MALALVLVSCDTSAPGSSGPVRAAVQPDVPVTAVNVDIDAGHNSPTLAVDPDESQFAVLAQRLDAPDYGCGLQLSGDGGRTWIGAQPVPRLPEGAEKCYAPEVAFGRGGRLHYLFVGLHTAGNVPMGVFLTSSDDRGQSFETPRRILGPLVFGVRMVIDRQRSGAGRMHLAYIQAGDGLAGFGFPAPPNPVLHRFSNDGGRTFSEPVTVSEPQRRVTAPSLVLGRDHAVHVGYYDLGDDQRDYQGLEGPTYEGTWSLVVASSPDGDGQFDPPVVAEPEVVPPERVLLVFTMPPASLAADRQGRLFLAWHDARNRDWDVFLRRSLDGGPTWQPAQRVNDDPVGNGRTQYLPRVSVAPEGRVDMIYYDRRNDANDVRNDVSFAWSGDRGASFAPSVRLNRESFDSRIGSRYAVPYNTDGQLVEFGSRLGLASQDDLVLAAWTDTRMAYRSFTAVPALAETTQSIYATRIRMAS